MLGICYLSLPIVFIQSSAEALVPPPASRAPVIPLKNKGECVHLVIYS